MRNDSTQLDGYLAHLLELQLEELRAIRTTLERRRSSPCDEAAVQLLLGAIHEHAGDRLFSARELVEHGQVAPRLREAIETAGCGCSARRIGRALRRAAGVDLGSSGLRVKRVGVDRNGIVWQVVVDASSRVSEPRPT